MPRVMTLPEEGEFEARQPFAMFSYGVRQGNGEASGMQIACRMRGAAQKPLSRHA